MRPSGLITPMVTPTEGRDGGIDTAALRTHTRYLVDNGVDGLFPCGTTGEFTSLTRAERRTVVDVVSDAAPDTPVLAGCGGTNARRIQQYVDDAADAGADAAVVVTPYYLTTSQRGLRDLFLTVAAESSLPVLLYEIPALAGHTLDVETVVDLAAHDNIVGLKTSAGDVLYQYSVARRTPDDFAVYQGATELALASLDVGGDGIIAGPSNVFPATMGAIVDAYRDGDRGRAVELMNEVVLPLLVATESLTIAAAYKFLLRLLDFDVGPPVRPLAGLTDDQQESLAAVLDDVADAALADAVPE